MKRTIGNLSLNVEGKGAGEISLVFLHYWGGTHRTSLHTTPVTCK